MPAQLKTPFVLLKIVAKALAGAWLDADFGARQDLWELLPSVAADSWECWGKSRSDSERAAEIQAIAQAPSSEIKRLATEVSQEVAANSAPEVREAIAGYVAQIPAVIRRTMLRPSGPSGATVPTDLRLRRAEDLLRLLPTRLPSLQAGQRPFPGVDLELVELVGIGGFGEVWKARNPVLTNAPAVALKFCLDPDLAKTLRHEAAIFDRIMRNGRHPGIVELRHTYLNNDPPCLEYEFVEGGDLAGLIQDWHRKKAGPTGQEAARVIRRLAEIMAFAHQQDPPIAHRDLKPANILVQRLANGKSALRIADFGIGGVATRQAVQTLRKTASTLLLSASGSYTPLYASPQQMRGDPPDPRDDVYSLGVIWYQLLIGDLNTGAPTGLEWPKQLVKRGVGEEHVQLIAACLDTDPSIRPASAQALAELLARRTRSASTHVPATANNRGSASPAGEIRRFLGHENEVTGVAFSPDGRRILTGGVDKTLRMWDLSTGDELWSLRWGTWLSGYVHCLRRFEDGRRALVGVDMSLRIIDLENQRESNALLGHTGDVTAMAVSRDGSLAVSGSYDKTVRIWKPAAGTEVCCLHGHRGLIRGVASVAISPDSTYVLSGGVDGSIRVWDIEMRRQRDCYFGRAGAVWAIAFTPDGSRAIYGGRDGVLRVLDPLGGTPLGQWTQASISAIWCLDVSHDGQRLVSGSEDGGVRVWDTSTGDLLKCLAGHGRGVTSVAFSPDDLCVVSGSKDHSVRLWSVAV